MASSGSDTTYNTPSSSDLQGASRTPSPDVSEPSQKSETPTSPLPFNQSRNESISSVSTPSLPRSLFSTPVDTEELQFIEFSSPTVPAHFAPLSESPSPSRARKELPEPPLSSFVLDWNSIQNLPPFSSNLIEKQSGCSEFELPEILDRLDVDSGRTGNRKNSDNGIKKSASDEIELNEEVEEVEEFL